MKFELYYQIKENDEKIKLYVKDYTYDPIELTKYKEEVLEKHHLKFLLPEKLDKQEDKKESLECALALKTIKSLNLPQLNL